MDDGYPHLRRPIAHAYPYGDLPPRNAQFLNAVGRANLV